MIKDSFTLTASDGFSIVVHRWLPDGKPNGVLQISHGMAEFAMRYDHFAEAAVKAGMAVFAQDHRGHGETAGTLDRLGYLADRGGFERVAQDLREVTLHVQGLFPGLPIFLFGHSFGSFVSQMYIERFGDLLSGCVLSGTRGPDPLTVAGGRLMAGLVCLFRGKKRPSPFLTALSFGTYNARIPGAKSPNSWLSRDEGEVERYDASPWTGFTCTSGFYRDLMHGLSLIHRTASIRAIPRALPVLIMSGSDDPVGGYGKTVSRLAELYRAAGMGRVHLKLYEGGRHEMLNETNKAEVVADVLAWIASVRKPGA